MNRRAIVYASDDNYAHVMGTSLLSVLRNYEGGQEFDIHIISNGMGNGNKKRIRQIADRYRRDVYFYDIREFLSEMVSDDVWNITTYARLFIADLLPGQVEKAVYIDCDTVAIRSVGRLFEFECGKGNAICGVLDRYNLGSARRLGLSDRIYINAGVLVMDLVLWREQNISMRIKKRLKERRWLFPDQDILNYELNGQIGILPMEYNMYMFSRKMPYKDAMRLSQRGIEKFYSQKDYEYAKKHTVVIHFAGNLFNRPWQKGSRQADREIFYYYFSQTPWKGKAALQKRKYTDKLATSVYFWFWEKILLRLWEKGDYARFADVYIWSNAFPDKVKKAVKEIKRK